MPVQCCRQCLPALRPVLSRGLVGHQQLSGPAMASEPAAAIDHLDAVHQPGSHRIDAKVVAGRFGDDQRRLRGACAIDFRPTVLLDDPHRISVLKLAIGESRAYTQSGKTVQPIANGPCRRDTYSEESFQPRCFQPNSPLRPRRFTYISWKRSYFSEV